MSTIAQSGRDQWIADLCVHLADVPRPQAGWLLCVTQATR